MPKTMPYVENGEVTGQMIWCPACACGHLFNTEPKNPNGAGGHKPTWTWDGNQESPTFAPSMLVKTNDPSHPHYQPRAASSVCHSFVRGGNIEFLADCTHPLAGTTVPLPDWDDPAWKARNPYAAAENE